MKRRHFLLGLLVVGIVGILLCLPYVATTYALCSRNLDMVFRITDAATGEPLPNVSIDLFTVDYSAEGDRRRLTTLTTDHEGKAEYFREDNLCEDIIRPLRKTVTLIDLTWALIDVKAKGYCPIDRIWLDACEYENQGYEIERNSHRLLFNISLQRYTESR